MLLFNTNVYLEIFKGVVAIFVLEIRREMLSDIQARLSMSGYDGTRFWLFNQRGQMSMSVWSALLGRRWSLLWTLHSRFSNLFPIFVFSSVKDNFIESDTIAQFFVCTGPCPEGSFLHPGQEVQSRGMQRQDPLRRTLHQVQVSWSSVLQYKRCWRILYGIVPIYAHRDWFFFPPHNLHWFHCTSFQEGRSKPSKNRSDIK